MAAPNEIEALTIEVRRLARQLAQHIADEDTMRDGLQATLSEHQDQLLARLADYRDTAQVTTWEVDKRAWNVEKQNAEQTALLTGLSLQIGVLATEQAAHGERLKSVEQTTNDGAAWRAKEDRERASGQKWHRLIHLGTGAIAVATLVMVILLAWWLL